MKAYKGFMKDKDGRIYCHNKFYYKEGKTYKCKKAKLCRYGFHACTLPIDVFCYYNSDYDSVEFHEVELENISDECGNDSKVVGTKITIGRKINPDEMLDISIQMIMENKEKYFKNNKPYLIRKDEKCNFLKPDGTYLSNQWFDYVWNFINGFAQVKLNNKMNIIKEDGTYLTEQWFDNACSFNNGFAVVKLNNHWYKLNDKGELIK